MRKRISLKTRRPDLSRADFRDYYENKHVPLGLSFIDVFQWRRYVRNHVVRGGGALVPYDGFAEFWVSDEADDEALNKFLRSPEFKALDEDDRRFLDISRRLSFEVHESVLIPPPERGRGLVKVAVTWLQEAGPHSHNGRIADRLIDAIEGVRGAELNEAVEALPPQAPFDTMLVLYLERLDPGPLEMPAAAAPEGRWSIIELDPVETPAKELACEN